MPAWWPVSGGRWVALALVMALALVFSLIVGNYLARLYEPRELGSSATGEWADLSEYGFRMRLDDVTKATSFPSSYGEGEYTTAEEGTELLRIQLSIEPLVGPEEDVSCRFELYNGDGEKLGLKELTVDGPAAVDCTAGFDDPRPMGVAYDTQMVHVVIPEPVENYTLEMYPLAADSTVYWTFTP